MFFLDLPGREQKDAIWAIYLAEYHLDDSQPRPDDTNWTGGEIKSCCRLASLLDVPLVQAAQNVVPVAVTAGDKIEGLRQWASGRCLSADQAGIYCREQQRAGSRARRVVRESGVNCPTQLPPSPPLVASQQPPGRVQMRVRVAILAL